MDVAASCPVARGVLHALRDGAADYDARGILVATSLEPDSGLETADEIVYQAVYTVFRALPPRLARGGTLRVASQARAGGDVELDWTGMEDAALAAPSPAGLTPAEALARGPFGDLVEVAILALEEVCRARGGLVERPQEAPRSSSIIRDPVLYRRYLFLIPGRARAAYAPQRASARPPTEGAHET